MFLISAFVEKANHKIILCRDFNFDILNYDNKENTLNLLNSVLIFHIGNYQNQQSRITDQTATLIDNIFMTKPNGFVSGIYTYL